MRPHYDIALVPGRSEELLLDTLAFVLNGYQPRPGQTRIEHAELRQLARNFPEAALHVLERSQVWVEL